MCVTSHESIIVQFKGKKGGPSHPQAQVTHRPKSPQWSVPDNWKAWGFLAWYHGSTSEGEETSKKLWSKTP